MVNTETEVSNSNKVIETVESAAVEPASIPNPVLLNDLSAQDQPSLLSYQQPVSNKMPGVIPLMVTSTSMTPIKG